jgi:hypothetical protein
MALALFQHDYCEFQTVLLRFPPCARILRVRAEYGDTPGYTTMKS